MPGRPSSRGHRSARSARRPSAHDLDEAVRRLPQADAADGEAGGLDRLPDGGGDEVGRRLVEEGLAETMVVGGDDVALDLVLEVGEVDDDAVVADRAFSRRLEPVAVAV